MRVAVKPTNICTRASGRPRRSSLDLTIRQAVVTVAVTARLTARPVQAPSGESSWCWKRADYFVLCNRLSRATGRARALTLLSTRWVEASTFAAGRSPPQRQPKSLATRAISSPRQADDPCEQRANTRFRFQTTSFARQELAKRPDQAVTLRLQEVHVSDGILLRHHLGNEDRVRIARAPPREVAPVCSEPGQEQLVHPCGG